MSIRAATVVVACAVAAVGAAWSQPPDAAEMARQYAQNAQRNATLMKQYSWKMRVELTVKGEVKPAEIWQMRYDIDGRLQKTALTAPNEPRKKRGLRGAIQKSKTEDFKEWVGQLMELAKDYMAPTPGNMMDFYGKAQMSAAPDGTVQASSSAFLKPGDRATFWLNRDTKAALRFRFASSLEGDAVEGNVEYGQVPDGPQYAARVVVSVPAKQVSAKIENFEFVKQ